MKRAFNELILLTLAGVLAVVCLVVMAGALGGCTAGQMAPDQIKDCVYAARAEAVVAAEQIRAGKSTLEDAAKALERIGGTPGHKLPDGTPAAYADGLLDPPVRWFRGQKGAGQ